MQTLMYIVSCLFVLLFLASMAAVIAGVLAKKKEKSWAEAAIWLGAVGGMLSFLMCCATAVGAVMLSTKPLSGILQPTPTIQATPTSPARWMETPTPSPTPGRRGFLGIFCSSNEGAVVDFVLSESPAEKAGLEPGDVIISLDNQPISNCSDLRRVVSERPGKRVNIVFVRNGEIIDTYVELGTRE